MSDILKHIADTFSTPVFSGFILIFLLFILTSLGVRLVQFLSLMVIKDAKQRYRTRKFVAFGGYLLLAIIVISFFSDRFGDISVAIGVAGAGIAFALQEVIASVAGWMAISFAGFYKPGDRVQLGGIKGDVIDVGVLRTTLMEIGDWVDSDLYNGRVVRVANSFVFKEPVFNYSGDFPFLWDEIKLPIHFDSDLEQAQKIIEAATTHVVAKFTNSSGVRWGQFKQKYLIGDPQIQPMVTLAANDNWIEFTVRYIVDYRERRKTRDKIMRLVVDDILKSDGRVRFASTVAELHIAQQASPPDDKKP